MKKTIFMIVFIAALIFIIGSIGALECDNISVFQCFIQCAICIGAEIFALRNLRT